MASLDLRHAYYSIPSAKVIGILVSTFSAVEYGKLLYRELERANFLALKQNKGKYGAKMVVTPNMKHAEMVD